MDKITEEIQNMDNSELISLAVIYGLIDIEELRGQMIAIETDIELNNSTRS